MKMIICMLKYIVLYIHIYTHINISLGWYVPPYKSRFGPEKEAICLLKNGSKLVASWAEPLRMGGRGRPSPAGCDAPALLPSGFAVTRGGSPSDTYSTAIRA